MKKRILKEKKLFPLLRKKLHLINFSRVRILYDDIKQ